LKPPQQGFYSCHGENALSIARTFYRTTAAVKYLSGDAKTGLPSVTLNRNMFEQVVLNKGFRLCILISLGLLSALVTSPFCTGLPSQVLRALLLEGTQHTVEVYEGYGSTWTLARCASDGDSDKLLRHAHIPM